jgi:hypothetical protein
LENNLGKYILSVTVHLVTIEKVTQWIYFGYAKELFSN